MVLGIPLKAIIPLEILVFLLKEQKIFGTILDPGFSTRKLCLVGAGGGGTGGWGVAGEGEV